MWHRVLRTRFTGCSVAAAMFVCNQQKSQLNRLQASTSFIVQDAVLKKKTGKNYEIFMGQFQPDYFKKTGYTLTFFFLNLLCFQKERKLLQVKRLDLDAAKTRLKKARMADARAAVSTHTLTHTHTLTCIVGYNVSFLFSCYFTTTHELRCWAQRTSSGVRVSTCPLLWRHSSSQPSVTLILMTWPVTWGAAGSFSFPILEPSSRSLSILFSSQNLPYLLAPENP